MSHTDARYRFEEISPTVALHIQSPVCLDKLSQGMLKI